MFSATLIALVGPSGAGKTTLARALQAAGFGRIPTTTTRSPRADEVVGRDLFSVPAQRFNQMRTSNEVIAAVEYSSASYGVQLKHLRAAAQAALPQIIIVEPSGLPALRLFADRTQMRFLAVFVTLPAEAVSSRLQSRYSKEDDRDDELADRLARAISEVNQWRPAYPWDLVLESGDMNLDIESIYELITRPAEPSESFAASA